jgi:DnaJ-class molecular chaperone
MSLESAVKYFFPKSTQISDSPRATASEALTGTDQMAAMGMVQSMAPMGFSAFLGKVGVSNNDSRRAVTLLTEYALQTCDKVAALRKLDTDIKPAVMQTLATYAYQDYCRSAASLKPCDCCAGEGFIAAEVVTMKSMLSGVANRQVREQVRVLCKPCKGKGVISAACRDCSGRGRAVDRKKTEEQGLPVMCDCKQCGGRGYDRIPSTEAYRAVCKLTDSISQATWEKSGKKFYDQLLGKVEIEESWANSVLSKVTA